MASTRNGEEIDLKADLESLKADVAALTGDLKKLVAREGGKAYEKVKDVAGDAKEAVSEGADRVGAVVSERPLTSLVVAFLGGILLGKLTSR